MRLIDADALKEIIFKKTDSLEDLWDTAGLLNAINNAQTVDTTKAEHKAYNEGFKDGVDQGIKLSEIPQGKWIFHKDYNESCRYGCNQCGNLTNVPGNFCPNCGAKMQKFANKT